MTYEYKGKLYANSVVHSMTENVFIETGETKELQEVYRKAKAFDAIVDIQDDFVKYHGFYPCVEEYAEEVEEIISEYMGRADDER